MWSLGSSEPWYDCYVVIGLKQNHLLLCCALPLQNNIIDCFVDDLCCHVLLIFFHVLLGLPRFRMGMGMICAILIFNVLNVHGPTSPPMGEYGCLPRYVVSVGSVQTCGTVQCFFTLFFVVVYRE